MLQVSLEKEIYDLNGTIWLNKGIKKKKEVVHVKVNNYNNHTVRSLKTLAKEPVVHTDA